MRRKEGRDDATGDLSVIAVVVLIFTHTRYYGPWVLANSCYLS